MGKKTPESTTTKKNIEEEEAEETIFGHIKCVVVLAIMSIQI